LSGVSLYAEQETEAIGGSRKQKTTSVRYLKVRATTFYGDSRLLADVFRQGPLSLLRKRYILSGIIYG
jgi:hypothetical protein